MLLDSSTGNFVLFTTTFLVLFISFFKWKFQYWKKRGVPYLQPSIPGGSIPSGIFSGTHTAIKIKYAYDEMKRKGWRHGGLYGTITPLYLPVDLTYIKNITTKDFQYFTERGVYHNEHDDPLSAHLFNIGGSKWRNLRAKLTPTFTSGRMKLMFETLLACEAGLQKKIEQEITKDKAIDIKDILGCFTTDIIGSCAFGLDCKTFEHENSPFREYGKRIFDRSIPRALKFVLLENFSRLSKALHLKLIPSDISSFFTDLVKDTVKYRETESIVRHDFMQLLIDLKNNKVAQEKGYQHDGQSLTIEEIAAQCYVFFLAGFETSSTTMAFALYELAKNPSIQEKLREEVNHTIGKNNGRLTYDAVMEMKYMDQVVDETLRKYPPGGVVPRKCVKDYNVPDTNVIIEKGTTVLIPIYAIHHDPEYYPEPEKFDPERFNVHGRASRPGYTHIPFGEGPRICIGMRFGLLETKVGLASLLHKFKFSVNSKTKEPFHMKPNSIVLAVEGEIWLNGEKLG